MGHRLRVNLTPLLDVLLLMIFAFQFQSRLIVADARTTTSVTLKDIEQVRSDASRLRELNDRLAAENADLLAQLKADRAQAQGLAKLLSLAYAKIAQNDFYEVLLNATPADREQIRLQLEKLRDAKPEKLLAELARSAAFGRYITVCEVRLEDEMVARVSVDEGEPLHIALPPNPVVLRSRLSRAMRQAIEPTKKDQVFVFVNWTDVLKVRKDQVEAIVSDIALEDLKQAFPGVKIHFIREGYRP